MARLILRHSRYLILGILSIGCVIAAWMFQQQLSSLQGWGLIGILVINFIGTATLFLPAPAIVTVFAGGHLYPVPLVALYATLGAVAGDLIGYLLGYSGNRLLEDHNKTFEKIITLFKRYGGVVIFVFAFVPNPLFDAIGLVAGAFRYPPWKYILFLFLGRLLRNLLVAYIGAGL
jgi:membrane protein YqaA with SNARE-associated domain